MSAQTPITSSVKSPKNSQSSHGNAHKRLVHGSSESASAIAGGHAKSDASEAGAVGQESFHKRRQSDEVEFPLSRVDSHFTVSDYRHPYSNFTHLGDEDCTGLDISGDEPFNFSCPHLECPRKFASINDVYKHEPELVDKPLFFITIIEHFLFCRCSHALGIY